MSYGVQGSHPEWNTNIGSKHLYIFHVPLHLAHSWVCKQSTVHWSWVKTNAYALIWHSSHSCCCLRPYQIQDISGLCWWQNLCRKNCLWAGVDMGSIFLQIFHFTSYNAQLTCFACAQYLVDLCLPTLKLFMYASKNRDACKRCAWTSADCADDTTESCGLSARWNGRWTWELECRLKYLACALSSWPCFLTFRYFPLGYRI